MNYQRHVHKFWESATSLKVGIIVLSSLLFYFDKLSESGWITMVLSTTALRQVHQTASLFFSKAPTPDDPDDAEK